ncbi:MAG: GAF domain-containing sensor histidine kinase [Candidatus Doudnabacteria bacterium]|nr:GAF domain-containing sensor histidine kinase [Candidatus Doudnabacteria bacterium]
MDKSIANRITLLNQTALDSLNDVSEREIIGRFTETGVKILDGDFGFAWLKGKASKYELAYKSPGLPYEPPPPRRGGINYQVKRTRIPFFAIRVKKETDPRYDVSRYMESYVIIPVFSNKVRYGNIVICFVEHRTFSAYQRSLCAFLGNIAAQAITLHGLYSDLKHFKDSLDRTLDSIIIFDSSSFRIEYANHGAAALLNIPQNKLLRQKILEVLPQGARARFMAILQSLLKDENKTFVFETNLPSAQKKSVSTEFFIQLIETSSQPRKFLMIGQDISGRKISERQIQKLLRQKDEFLGVASHELRTPITTIKGFAQLLQKRSLSGDKQMNYYATKINTQTDKLARLVEELLDVSKIEAGKLALKRQKIKLNDLLQEISEGLQLSTTQHEFILNGKVRGFVPGDPDRLSQVFTNILANAIKYSPNGGQIIVRLRQKRGVARISIQDFGVGIPKRHQRQIFNRFFQGRNVSAFPGLGLGLYISREIVRRHGGDIWFESEQGQGTTFHVELPRRKISV